MKTKIIFVALICSMSAFNILAQPNTGQTTYSHSVADPTLSSGTYVSSDPGFVMAGFSQPTSSGPNLVIDKVDVDGLFNGSTGEFSKQYTISTGGTGCNVSISQATNCAGVSIIETFQGNDHYAIAAAFEEGLIVAFLNQAGDPTTSKFYPFPVLQSFHSKPLITESSINSGNYYISGSYRDNSRDYIYVIKTDLNFSTGWTNIYDLGNNTIFSPKGIVESSFNVGTGELVVAGMCDGQGNGLDGFVMALDDATNGNVNFSYIYYSSTTITDWFSSIQLANSNSGYIIGGKTNDTSKPGYAWMINLGTTGGINWSSQIEFTNDNTAGEVVGVQERYSSSNSNYEYYGATTSTIGMGVCKLDNTGAAFSAITSTNNEFFYISGSGSNQPNSISTLNTPNDPNEGIHVFGNSFSSPNEFFMTQACFNGPTGDVPTANQIVTGLNNVTTGPNSTATLNISHSSSMQQCSFYNISNSTISTTSAQTPTYLTGTWPSNPYSGSNAKLFNPVSSNSNQKIINDHVSFFPNPAYDFLNVSIQNPTNRILTYEIIDCVGKIVVNEGAKITSNNSFKIDVKELGLPPSIYFIKINTLEAIYESKFIISSE